MKLIVILITSVVLLAGNAGNSANIESRYIVDMPTAGIIQKGEYSVYTNAYTQGGLLLELTASIFQNFNMALSYSGVNVIGSGNPEGPDYPGIHLKYRVIQERKLLPAFVLGVSTQGRGAWDRSSERFETLSPGVYIASSKSFDWFLGYLGLHAGLNYSFEQNPENRAPNFYFGAEQAIGSSFAILAELNGTFDDNNREFNRSNGLANLGIRWGLAKGLTMEIQLRDIFDTQKKYNEFTRYIALEFVSGF